MDIVTLPTADVSRTVGDVLQLMKTQGVSGVAVPRGPFVGLIGYGNLANCGLERSAQLGRYQITLYAPAIGSRETVRLHLEPSLRVGGAALPDSDPVQDLLRGLGYPCAAFGPLGALANIVSLPGLGLIDFRSAPRDCYCTNPIRSHGYGRNHPQFCREDGTEIRCF